MELTKGRVMTDFNYNEFSTDVLINALKREKSYIQLLQSDCKHFARKIERRRGYSHKALEAYAQTIGTKQLLITKAQEEVAELESVIAQRAA